jgi:hypothetical protein
MSKIPFRFGRGWSPRQVIGRKHPVSIEELQRIARESRVSVTRLPEGGVRLTSAPEPPRPPRLVTIDGD